MKIIAVLLGMILAAFIASLLSDYYSQWRSVTGALALSGIWVWLAWLCQRLKLREEYSG